MGPSGSDIGPAKQEMLEGTSKKGFKVDVESEGSIGGVKVAALASDLRATELASDGGTQGGELSPTSVPAKGILNPQGGELSLTKGSEKPPEAKSVSFPTEQRVRQREKKKAGHVAKKRPQVVEDHHDDCGEDFGPLGDDSVAEHLFDGPEGLTEDSDGEETCVLAADLAQHDEAGDSAMQFSDLGTFMVWSSAQRGGCLLYTSPSPRDS